MSDHVVPNLSETTSAAVSDKVTMSKTFNKTFDDIWGPSTYDPNVVDDDEFLDDNQLHGSGATPDDYEVSSTNLELPAQSLDQPTSSDTSYSGPLVLNPNIPSTAQYEADVALFTEKITPVDACTEYDTNDAETSTGEQPYLEDREQTKEEIMYARKESENVQNLDFMQRHFYAITQCHFDQYLKWHEEQRADPEATASQPTEPPPPLVHHFNFFGNPVFTRNFANPLYSLRLILRGSYHSMDTSPLRQAMLTHQVVSKIDPVFFAGTLDELLALNSLSPEDFFRQLCGRVLYSYAPYGQFGCDQLSQDDYAIARDPMNLECYKVGDKENTILNGWYQRQNSKETKTAYEFFTTSSVNADQLISSAQESYKERGTRGPTRSRLCGVMNVDDEGDHHAKSTSSEEQDAQLWTSSEDEESDATAPENHYCSNDVEMKDVNDLEAAESDSYSAADVRNEDPLPVETPIPDHIAEEVMLASAIPLPLDVEVDSITADFEATIENNPATDVFDQHLLHIDTCQIDSETIFDSSFTPDVEVVQEEDVSIAKASYEDPLAIEYSDLRSLIYSRAMYDFTVTPIAAENIEETTGAASDDVSDDDSLPVKTCTYPTTLMLDSSVASNVDVAHEEDPAANAPDENNLTIDTHARCRIDSEEMLDSSLITDVETAHEEVSAVNALDEDRLPIDHRRTSSHVDAEAMFDSRITPNVEDAIEDVTGASSTNVSDEDSLTIDTYSHYQIDAEVMYESSTPTTVEETIEELTNAASILTDEPSKVKVNHYWTKLRTQSPVLLQTTSKSAPKKSLRNTLKEAAWRLAPWALRPIGM